jgi:hypothetical protein
VGRETDLANLHGQLQPRKAVAIAAIAGMGGIGKTELALQYALKHLDLNTYPGGVCWLRARQEVPSQIVEFARTHLGLTPPEDYLLEAQVRWCWQHWRQGEALIVFDDVQDYSEIEGSLAPLKSGFTVLLTTRLQIQSDPVRSLTLDFLPPLAAFQLLYETLVRQGGNRDTIRSSY